MKSTWHSFKLHDFIFISGKQIVDNQKWTSHFSSNQARCEEQLQQNNKNTKKHGFDNANMANSKIVDCNRLHWIFLYKMGQIIIEYA